MLFRSIPYGTPCDEPCEPDYSRIDVLEREIAAMKAEIAALKAEREPATANRRRKSGTDD